VLQFLQEVYVCHGFLCWGPVNLWVTQVRQDTLQGEFSRLIRILYSFQLKHVFLVQHIDGFIRRFKCGLCSQQLHLCFLLDYFNVCGFRAHLGGLLLRFMFFHCGNFLLLRYQSRLFLGICLLNVKSRPKLC
jgi:hypothetical protein